MKGSELRKILDAIADCDRQLAPYGGQVTEAIAETIDRRKHLLARLKEECPDPDLPHAGAILNLFRKYGIAPEPTETRALTKEYLQACDEKGAPDGTRHLNAKYGDAITTARMDPANYGEWRPRLEDMALLIVRLAEQLQETGFNSPAAPPDTSTREARERAWDALMYQCMQEHGCNQTDASRIVAKRIAKLVAQGHIQLKGTKLPKASTLKTSFSARKGSGRAKNQDYPPFPFDEWLFGDGFRTHDELAFGKQFQEWQQHPSRLAAEIVSLLRD